MGQSMRLILLILSVLCFSFGQAHAKTSEADALFNKGKAYHDGAGVVQNHDVARAYYEYAAAAGSSDAQLNLGYLYFVGEGVSRNFSTARMWYEKAAKAGDVSAARNLDFMNKEGLGLRKTSLPQNPKPAPEKVTPVKVKPAVLAVVKTPKTSRKALSPSLTLTAKPMTATPQISMDLASQIEPSKTMTLLQASLPSTSLRPDVILSGPLRANSAPLLSQVDTSSAAVKTDADAMKVVSTVTEMPLVKAERREEISVSEPVMSSLSIVGASAFFKKGKNIGQVFIMLLVFTLIGIIAFVDYRITSRRRAQHGLAGEFFEHNRRMLRETYIRYKAELRDMRHCESPLDAVLSVLIVRYVIAMRRSDDPSDLSTQNKLASKIYTAAYRHPAKSRHLAGAVAPHVLDLIRREIRARDKEIGTPHVMPYVARPRHKAADKPTWKPRLVKSN